MYKERMLLKNIASLTLAKNKNKFRNAFITFMFYRLYKATCNCLSYCALYIIIKLSNYYKKPYYL